MSPITQNNKIALAAVSVFLASFSSMLIFMDGAEMSPQYLKSNVIESALNGEGSGTHGSVHFSESASEGAHGTEASSKASEEEKDLIKEKEDLYRALLKNFSDPFVVLEPNGKPKFISKDFTEKYGYNLANIGKDGFFSHIVASDLPNFVTEYTSVLQSGKAVQKVGPYRFNCTDDKKFVHLISLLPVVDDEGRVTDIIGNITDITSTVEEFKE